MRYFHYCILFLFLISSYNTHLFAQQSKGIITGKIVEANTQLPLEFVYINLKKAQDSTFVAGTLTDIDGRFILEGIKAADYILEISLLGYLPITQPITLGNLVPTVNMGSIIISPATQELKEIVIQEDKEALSKTMERKAYSLDNNISQIGGTVLEAIRNLPGITQDKDGKLIIRGSDKVIVMIDGKQSSLTGYSAQQALDNIPASSIEKIEIIHNPSAKFDASGMAGVINLVLKKNSETGWTGKIGLGTGLGVLTKKFDNDLKGAQIHPTPKINPSLSLNYKNKKLLLYLQSDLLIQRRLVKNEFISRNVEGVMTDQIYIENRVQPITNINLGMDYYLNKFHTLTLSTLYNNRAYVDRGYITYKRINSGNTDTWNYYEDEVNRTFEQKLAHVWKFKLPGQSLKSSIQYSQRGKDEVFYFENKTIEKIGRDTFFLGASEQTWSMNIDYQLPLFRGLVEIGTQQRWRNFPNSISFLQGENSIMNPRLSGTSTYNEVLSALYSNYTWEKSLWQVEAGLRYEYANINYDVDPNHLIYKSSGFEYNSLFPSLKISLATNPKHRWTIFYNRRVDRPSESNLRSFPTYADPEILRIGNPNLLPQFANSFEIAYKNVWEGGYLYSAAYLRLISQVLTNYITSNSNEAFMGLTSIDGNAGKSSNKGIEIVLSQKINSKIKSEINANIYNNVIEAFSLYSPFDITQPIFISKRSFLSGNIKMNNAITFPANWKGQLSIIYFAPDILPQGEIGDRFTVDFGAKKEFKKTKGEFIINITDVFNTLRIKTKINDPNFTFLSNDYYETQGIRLTYNVKF